MSNIVQVPNLETIHGEASKKHGQDRKKKIFNYLFKLFGLKHKHPLNLSSFLDDIRLNIIDVGASIGFHERWEQLGSQLNIFLFEPDNNEFKKISELYSNDSRVKLFNVALSEHGKDISIYVNTWVYSSSGYEHNQDFFSKLNMRDFYKPLKTIQIPSKRLVDVIDEEIDFIKLDVEGFELSILRGSDDMLDMCIGVESEVSYTKWAKNLPLFSDVDTFLQGKGFRLCRLATPSSYHYILPAKMAAQGIVFSGDVLYFRDPYSIVELINSQKWEISKILKGIAIYLVYGNVEFAFILMEEAVKYSWIDNKSEKYFIIKNLIELRCGYNVTRKQQIIEQKLRRIFKVYGPEDSLSS